MLLSCFLEWDWGPGLGERGGGGGGGSGMSSDCLVPRLVFSVCPIGRDGRGRNGGKEGRKLPE